VVIWAPESQATKMLGDMSFSDKRVALHLHKGYISTLTGSVRALDRLPDYLDVKPTDPSDLTDLYEPNTRSSCRFC
jgi:hypothetical protein